MLKWLISLVLLATVYSQSNGVCDCRSDIFVGNNYCLCKNIKIETGSESFTDEIIHDEERSNFDITKLMIVESEISFNSPLITNTFPNLAEVELFDVGLKTLVPIKHCKNLRYFAVGQNSLSTVEAGIFDNCTSLTHIALYGNVIDFVNNSAFERLEKLQTLQLSDNLISAVNRQMFSPLSNLLFLYLANNIIQFLPEKVFYDLTKLQTLTLSGNEITEIHSTSFASLTSLNFLSLNDNHLTTLDNLLANNQNLVYLHLDRNEIDSIHQDFFSNLLSLKNLFLERNVCIDKTFEFIYFEKFATDVYPALETCFKNYKGKSPGAVPENAKICEYFQHDKFRYTCELKNVNFNHLNTSFPITGDHLNGLRNIDVKAVIFTNSNITKIPSEIFGSFPLIETLIASQIGIERADEQMLEICGQLKYIDLSGNKISLIADDAFENCTSLTSINLSKNLIKTLPAKLFHKNLNLQSIKLDDNKIAAIDPCNNVIRFQLRKLKNLSLRRNICVNNVYRHPILHLLFKELVWREIRVCYSYWFL